jgi:hypothetical protein
MDTFDVISRFHTRCDRRRVCFHPTAGSKSVNLNSKKMRYLAISPLSSLQKSIGFIMHERCCNQHSHPQHHKQPQAVGLHHRVLLFLFLRTIEDSKWVLYGLPASCSMISTRPFLLGHLLLGRRPAPSLTGIWISVHTER